MTATARIQFDGVSGTVEHAAATIGTPVVLTNESDVDVTSWVWQLLTVPDGSAAVLTTPTAATSGFTPDVTGSYRVRLNVNRGQAIDSRILTVTTVGLPLAQLAVGETTERDATYGWGLTEQRDKARIAGMLGSGAPVLCRVSGDTVAVGDAVHVSGIAADGYPEVTLTTAAGTPADADVGIATGGIDGATTVAAGVLCRVIFHGFAGGVSPGGSPSVGDALGIAAGAGLLVGGGGRTVARWYGDGIVMVGADIPRQIDAADGEVIVGSTAGAPVGGDVALADLARRAATPTAGHIATLDADGDPVDSGYTIESVGSDVLLTSAAAITTAFASTDAAYLNKHLVVAAGKYTFADDVVIAGNRHITCRPGVRFEFAAGKKLRTRCSADGTWYDSISRTVTYAAGVFTLSSGDWSTVGADDTWVLAVAGHGLFVPQTVNATTITPTYAPLADHQISAVHFALFKPVDDLVMDGQLTMTVAGSLPAEFVGLRYADLSGLRLTLDAAGYTASGVIIAFFSHCYASLLPHIVVQRYLATTNADYTVIRFANNFNCGIKFTAANNSLVAALSAARACNAMTVLYCADCDIDATIGNLYAADSGAAYAVHVRGIFAYLDYRCAFTGRAWPVRWGGHGSSMAKGIDVNGGANNIVTGFYSGGETS